MQKINESKKILILILFCFFIGILLCNIFTPMVADDFSFNFSAYNGERMTEFSQIFTALKGHATHSNGRVVAHFFVYLMIILPKMVFNVVNSLMFVLQIFLMYYICKKPEKHNNLLLVAIFGCIWMFELVFGQVNLWIAGACNYLWAFVFGLLFLLPFILDYLYDRPTTKIWVIVLHLLVSVIAGAYSENGSAAFIGIAVLLVLFLKFQQKKKFRVHYLVSIVLSMLGFVSIFLSPGERTNKKAEFSFQTLRENFVGALKVLYEYRILLIIFVVLLVLAVSIKASKKRIFLSLAFVLGALGANFMLTFAAYYPLRSSAFTALLLILACGTLFEEVVWSNYKTLLVTCVAILSLFTVYHYMVGLNDIYNSSISVQANEEFIYECKEAGNLNIKVSLFSVGTKYNAFYGSTYLHEYNSWINKAMAKYYEVESLVGKWS